MIKCNLLIMLCAVSLNHRVKMESRLRKAISNFGRWNINWDYSNIEWVSAMKKRGAYWYSEVKKLHWQLIFPTANRKKLKPFLLVGYKCGVAQITLKEKGSSITANPFILFMVVPRGIEPRFPAWEAGVLTARRWDHGWGTRIRTSVAGSRILSPTTRRSPKRIDDSKGTA